MCELEVQLQKFLWWNFPTWKFMGCLRYIFSKKTWKERSRTWKSKDTKGNPSNHSCLHISGPFFPWFFRTKSDELGFKCRFLLFGVGSFQWWCVNWKFDFRSFFGGIFQLESLWGVSGISYPTWKSKDTKGNPSNHSRLHIYGPFSPTFFRTKSDELGFKCRFLCCLGLEVSSGDVWIGSSTSEVSFVEFSNLKVYGVFEVYNFKK